MGDATDKPRWASELSTEEWGRLNDLLYEGWQPAAVRRELQIADNKKRSLEQYARRFRNRRILAPVGKLAEMIANGSVELGPDFLRLLRMVIEQGLSDEHKSQRAAATLGKFFGKVLEVGARTEAAETERERDNREQGTLDAAAAMKRMLADYGVTFDGDTHE